MPKINVYLPDALAEAVKEAQLPVSSICQAALETAIQRVQAARDGRLYSRFTPRAQHVLELAREVARTIPNEHVDTVHLLVGIVDEGGNLGLKVLESLEIEPADLRAELMGSLPPKTSATIETPEYASGAMRALE
ncbi:MAG TPA: Clp protease N-terminal domain-containing protein, partial [Acidimicrobiales bacterium]|nr:Clp protease N-terminal domain-containing protein [Acidimicrobiales bacterium]